VMTIALGYVLFARGLAGLPASTATTLTLAEPLTAMLLGVLLLGERLPAVAWSGAALVAVGLVLAGERREGTGPRGPRRWAGRGQ
jgi:drug/metabolite transporter, DME family